MIEPTVLVLVVICQWQHKNTYTAVKLSRHIFINRKFRRGVTRFPCCTSFCSSMTAVIVGGGISGLASAYYLIRNSSPFQRVRFDIVSLTLKVFLTNLWKSERVTKLSWWTISSLLKLKTSSECQYIHSYSLQFKWKDILKYVQI